jgi:hypothetical protein
MTAAAAATAAPPPPEHVPPPVEDQPPAKRIKTTSSFDFNSATFSFVTGTSRSAELKNFVSEQITHYLGEAEASLIDFVHGHAMAGKPVHLLRPELADVLEEDVLPFLQAIYEKTVELSGS